MEKLQLNTYMFVNTQDINLCLLIDVEKKQLKYKVYKFYMVVHMV